MDKSFEELYQQLSDKHRASLEEIRKPIDKKLRILRIKCGVLCILSGIFAFHTYLDDGLIDAVFYGITVPLIGASFMLYILWYSPTRNRLMTPYVAYFRENVGASFVEKANPGATYDPEPSEEWGEKIMEKYADADFHSETCVMFPAPVRGSPGISNFMRGEIDGHPYLLACLYLECREGGDCPVKYKGMFAHMKVNKTLTGSIRVARKHKWSIGPPFIHGNEQKMDIPAFENDFYVASETQERAMMYLTADIQELLRDFKNELIHIQTTLSKARPRPRERNVNLDFIWRGDDVYLRIGGKKLFQPTTRDPMCKDSLACCLATMNFVAKLNKVIAKSVKETAI